ncbi:MAG: YhbY family RNA-binding protein [Cellvibrionales bacterium]|nr:YhbY family RNA-binding protein [Cellvibrionales bacterium]
MSLTNERKKYLRQLGHSLKPVVTVASKGVSETVLQELNRALEDHELIKVKLSVDDKAAAIQTVCDSANAELVQSIGHVLLIFRAAKKPNPKLSNLLKNQA